MSVPETGKWHTVLEGEWLDSIACDFRLPSSLIWDHANNASLKKRRDSNVLFPGDELFIPERRARETPCATDEIHRFKLKKVLVSFELTLLDPCGEPIRNERYTLGITDPALTGSTDGNGHLKHDNLDPGGITTGVLDLPDMGLQFEIDIGALNPSHAHATHAGELGTYDDGLSGVQMRLLNLGYHPGATDGLKDDSGQLPDDTALAIRRFQRFEMHLADADITGDLNDRTRDAINAKFAGA